MLAGQILPGEGELFDEFGGGESACVVFLHVGCAVNVDAGREYGVIRPRYGLSSGDVLSDGFGQAAGGSLDICISGDEFQRVGAPGLAFIRSDQPVQEDLAGCLLFCGSCVVHAPCGSGADCEPLIAVEREGQEGIFKALRLADKVLLVTTPEISSLRNSKAALMVFENIGVQKDKVRVVLNRSDANQSIQARDVSRTLEREIYVSLRDDARNLLLSQNEGRPLVSYAQKRGLIRDYQALAYKFLSESGRAPNLKKP